MSENEKFVDTANENEIWDLYDRDRTPLNKTMPRNPYNPTPGEYHIVIHAWIQNSKGEWLLSKRAPTKKFPLLWECTGGSVIAGETSIEGAVREIKEELGIDVNPETGKQLTTLTRDKYLDICDVWVFKHDCDISDVKLDPRETCDTMWASVEKINELVRNEEFVPAEHMSYMKKLFEVYNMENEEKTEIVNEEIETAADFGVQNEQPRQPANQLTDAQKSLLQMVRSKVPASVADVAVGSLMPVVKGLSDSDCENMQKIVKEKGLMGALLLGKKMKKKAEKNGEDLQKGRIDGDER